jgi:hypothetical protein
VVVFLLLGVIWAAVLVPPWLQSRREARPIASIMSFRSQLWSLQRATPHYATPHYGAQPYGSLARYDGSYEQYGAYDDGFEEVAEVADVAEVRPFARQRRDGRLPATAASGFAGAAMGALPDGPTARATSAPSVAVTHGRAVTYRRRRQVLSLLLLAVLAGVAPAVMLAGPWVVADAVASTLLVAYLGLLVRRGRREAERAQKVRYLTPIRAPRPAVVIIGAGAAR